MKEIITARGVLKYRMPNILEAYDLLDASEIGENNSMLRLKRNVIFAMKPLIDFSLIEGVSSYDQLLEDSENMMIPLSEIAEDVIVKTFDVFKKKS